jgi:predicted permease
MPKNEPTRLPRVEMRRITPGFFDVTQQRLRAGRLLLPTDDERPESPPVVVVNEALQRRDFPGRTAVGGRFHLDDTTFATIVGVVSNIRNHGPVQEPAPEMYWTYRQTDRGASTVQLMIRVARGDPMSIVPEARAAVRGIDPTAAVASVRTMNDVIAGSLGQPRFYLSLLGSFAAIALSLALAGLYGVLSYAVAQRTREIGIRAALGASERTLLRLVLDRGVMLTAVGLVIGLAGAFALTRLMATLLFGVGARDPMTMVGVGVILAGVALLASYVPARRAMKVDPIVALRYE